YRLELVDLADVPAFRFGVHPGPALVVLGALALHLIFGRDPDPDADVLVAEFAARLTAQHAPHLTLGGPALNLYPSAGPCNIHCRSATSMNGVEGERQRRPNMI